jgi:protease IV
MKNSSLLRKILIALLVYLVLRAWWHGMREGHKRHQGTLAVVHITGPIQASLAAPAWPATDADEVAKELHKLSEDDDVKAILLRINSPGGTVGAVQEIDKEMARCRAKGKKIVASLGEIAASGGYYLAAGSDRIVANPGTITGSIGVILEFGNLEGLFQKVGLKLEVIKSGAHKDIGSPARALTPEEKRMLQSSIDDAYDQFLGAVRDGRHLASDKLKTLADGRIFTGRQAMQVGLVDELGDQEDAVQAAIRLAKLPEKPFIISDEHKGLSGWLERTSSRLRNTPLESLQDTLLGSRVEYRWRP